MQTQKQKKGLDLLLFAITLSHRRHFLFPHLFHSHIGI